MALISLRQLLDHAAEHRYGLPAFNVNNMEQIQAIMQAAELCDSPVILQASAGARKYAGEPFLRKLVEAAIEQYPDIPVCLHQDHGTSPAVCQQSMRSGFSSVMMDGSLCPDGKTPSTYAYNVSVTARVVDMAHAIGVSVEGELGCLGSLETGEAGEEDGIGAAGKLDHAQLLTDPTRPPTLSPGPVSMRWPSPSAPATAPTSSPGRRPAKSSPSTASRPSMRASPTPTSSCTARPACRRSGWRSSASTAAR